MTASLGLGWLEVIALAVAFFAGGFAKGGVGFAFPIVVIPIATQAVPLELTLAVIAPLMPLLNIVQFANGGRMRETFLRFWPMLAGVALGVPVGAALFTIVDRDLLVIAVGLLVILFVVLTLSRPDIRIPQQAEKKVAAGAGVAAGIVGTLTTTNGPVFVTYLLGLQVDRQMLLSALGLFFLFSGTLITSSFIAIGVLDGPRALIALGCAVPCGLGIWTGNLAGRRIPAPVFSRIVLAVLFVLGLDMIRRGVQSF